MRDPYLDKLILIAMMSIEVYSDINQNYRINPKLRNMGGILIEALNKDRIDN